MNKSKLESEKTIGRLKNQLNQAELKLQYQNVVAPVTGIIFEPKARVSGVLGAGETILTIIPKEASKEGSLFKTKILVLSKMGKLQGFASTHFHSHSMESWKDP